MLKVMPYEKAVAAVAERFAKMSVAEQVKTSDAAGRICAEDVVSRETVPAFDRSTVDGYAVFHGETNAASAASPAVFSLGGEVLMGQPADSEAGDGKCVYVPTGGMLPKGADAVAMIEDAEKRGDEILLSKPLRIYENVTRKGEDIECGAAILKKGDVINACKAGALYAAGITCIKAVKRPRFYVISTGDELVDCAEECPAGKVRDVNTGLLRSAADAWEFAGAERVTDDFELLSQALTRAEQVADVILLSGGSSVGVADYTERLFAERGDLFLRGVAMKPGKPTLAAYRDGKLFVGLPGHPMAAYTAFRLIFERAYLRAAGAEKELFLRARAAVNFAGGVGRSCVMPVRLFRENGEVFAAPLFYKSGMISVLAACDGFTVIADYEEGVQKGEMLDIYGL